NQRRKEPKNEQITIRAFNKLPMWILKLGNCKSGDWGVESRTGAVTVASRWVCDSGFTSSPQSGLAWFCFLFPLIETDWQVSRIRLSEKTHAFAHGRLATRCGNWTKP